MRNIFVKTGLFFLILLTFSCAKKTEYLEAGGEKSTFKAKIAGTLTEFEMPIAYVYNLDNKKSLQIMGTKGTKTNISLTLFDYKGVGDYDLSNIMVNSAVLNFDLTKPLEGTFLATEGKITITQATATRVTGKFHFKGVNVSDNTEKNVTEGEFSITFTDPSKNPPIPVTPQNTNITANFDNTEIKFAGEANLISFTQPVVWTVMSIMGYNDKKMLSIDIDSYAGTGTFNVNANTDHGITYTTNFSVDANEYIATSGKIVVTQSTATRIKGTFEAVLEKATDPSKKITVKNGTFDMDYKKM